MMTSLKIFLHLCCRTVELEGNQPGTLSSTVNTFRVRSRRPDSVRQRKSSLRI
ncbi:hypothetical protein DPMN_027415 [Dreissena polymorpha]|uniref:Uncharacterized protein n=1 Tax=Dreissena polymorpha TaxID=45954 RepID=A0A9D4LTF6_DREPO|nr:hypothetical protein DPMN_027415 [Dreissena polymorpha]